jgi:hypothetical protein
MEPKEVAVKHRHKSPEKVLKAIDSKMNLHATAKKFAEERVNAIIDSVTQPGFSFSRLVGTLHRSVLGINPLDFIKEW